MCETLRRMQSYYAEEDRMTDAREAYRHKERNVKLSEEEITKQGEVLYVSVVKVVKREYPKKKGTVSVSCKLRPNSVFKYVVNKFKEKGWSAKHSYNDGYNDYDFIEVTPPKNDPTEGL